MYWNPDEYQEYKAPPSEIDYADPTYYVQSTESKKYQSAQPVQPLQPLNTYPDYKNDPTVINEYDTALSSPYTGPSSMEGYTSDVGAEQRDAATHNTMNAGTTRKRKAAGVGGVGAAIGGLLIKFGVLLAPVAKFGIAGITAIVSVVAYSFLFGWQFAIGLVALLFLHEMGHAIVMKMKGLPVGGMIFIPMLGAAVLMRQMPKNAKDEAEVGIAGPIAGAIASSICLIVALQSPHTPSIWAPLAYFGFFMNLFNLIPIVPFDGGRVLAAIDRRIWILGFIGLIAFQIWSWLNGSANIFLLLFIVMAGTQLWARRATTNSAQNQAYYAVPVKERIALSLLYFGLAAVLVLGMSLSHNLIFGWIR